MSTGPAGVAVNLRGDTPEGGQYRVKLQHWDELKRVMDEKLKGCIELEAAIDGGVLFCRMEDITEIFLMTEEYCANKDDLVQREKMMDGDA